MNIFRTDYYDVLHKDIKSIYKKNKDLVKKYKARPIRKYCKVPSDSQKRLNYIDGKILKYIIQAELQEQKARKKLQKKCKKGKADEDECATLDDVKNVIICEGECTINKEYLLGVVDNILDSLDQLSLSSDFEQRMKAQKKNKKIAMAVTLAVVAMSVASFGFGGIFSILSFGMGVLAKGVSGATSKNVLENDTNFIRDKYTLDRFGLHTTNSLSKKTYLKLQEVDKTILRLAQKYKKGSRDDDQDLINNVYDSIEELKEYIDKQVDKGIPKIAIGHKKKKVMSQLNALKTIKQYFEEYDQTKSQRKKIINILNHFSKFISEKNTRATMEEDLANAIVKYNEVNETTTKYFDEKDKNDLHNYDSLKTLILVLLHEYVTTISHIPDTDREIESALGDKIDHLEDLDREKIMKIFKKILVMVELNKKNELKKKLKNLNQKYNKNNIRYICNKINLKYQEKQKKSQSAFVNTVNIIKKLFNNFKTTIENIKSEEDMNNICVDLKYNKNVDESIKITDIKKIKGFLKKMNDIFVTMEASNNGKNKKNSKK